MTPDDAPPALRAEAATCPAISAGMVEYLTGMVAKRQSSAKIARSLGVTKARASTLLRRAGLSEGASRIVVSKPGERWRKLDGWAFEVSDLGRVRSLKPTRMHYGVRTYVDDGRLAIQLTGSEADPGLKSRFAIASLVLHSFTGSDLRRPAGHLNGDRMDCRLINLQPDMLRRGDQQFTPWTTADDRKLRQAHSIRDARRRTGRTETDVRARMADLGVDYAHPVRRALDDRDLALVQRAVAHLEDEGVGDREINVAMDITGTYRSRHADVAAAIRACIVALEGSDLTVRQVAEAFGWEESTAYAWRIKSGVAEPRFPEGRSTMAGEPEPIDGEEWRDLPGWPYRVSNMGRVTGRSGHLMKRYPLPNGTVTVRLHSPDGLGQLSVIVARLVLMLFRPSTPYSARRTRFLNGDRSDVRLDNMALPVSVAGPVVTRDAGRGGNVTGKQASFLDPLWLQADRAVPRGLPPEVRDDLISSMVVQHMEGRAETMAEAFKIAYTEHNRIMGTWTETSADAKAGGDGLSLLDRIDGAGEIHRSGRKTSTRSD